MRSPTRTPLLTALLAGSLLLLAGCGGSSGGVFIPDGEVVVDNASDFLGIVADDAVYFGLSFAGLNAYTADLLPFDLFPGESVSVGFFTEDFYDAFAEFFGGGFSEEFDRLVVGDAINVFEIYVEGF
jgi:hypothetical protein